jgi:glyoxylase-like metal-dependent hydrolase (beta-lactamase superfamily II)
MIPVAIAFNQPKESRMRRVLLSSLLLLAWVAAIAAQQAQPAPNVAEIQKVRDNLFLITGGGGNTAAFITSKGVVLVDTKNPNWGQAILDKVRTVTDKPITTIINTHTHGDHNGSNEFFPASVDIIAHENAKTGMEKMPAFQGEKAVYLPDRTYKDRMTIFSGADRVDLYYFGPGHTDGDTIVVFPALRVAHTGDLFARPATPLLDVNNGGSGVAMPQTLAKAAKGISGVETVIPGHSAATTWAAFVEFGEFNAAFLDAVRRAVNEGKTAEDAISGLTLPAKFKDYGMQNVKDNVNKIYTELKLAK